MRERIEKLKATYFSGCRTDAIGEELFDILQRLQSSPAPVVGGAPELTPEDVKNAITGTNLWIAAAARLNALLASRLSSIKPEVVVVPREKLEQLVRRFVDLSGEMASIRGICEADTRRAQDANFRAQATTNREVGG